MGRLSELTPEQRSSLIADIKAQISDMPKAVEDYLLSLSGNDLSDVKNTLKVDGKNFSALINDDVKLKVFINENGGYAVGLYNKDLSRVYVEHDSENAMGQSFSHKDEIGNEYITSVQFARKEDGNYTAHDSTYINAGGEIKSTSVDANFAPDGKSGGFTMVVSEAETDENGQVIDGEVTYMKSHITNLKDSSVQMSTIDFSRTPNEGGSLTHAEMESIVKGVSEDKKITPDEASILNEKGADYSFFSDVNTTNGVSDVSIQGNGEYAIEDVIGDYGRYSEESQKALSKALSERTPEINSHENGVPTVEFNSKDGEAKVSVEGMGDNAVVTVKERVEVSDKGQNLSVSEFTPKGNEKGKLDSKLAQVYKDHYSR